MTDEVKTPESEATEASDTTGIVASDFEPLQTPSSSYLTLVRPRTIFDFTQEELERLRGMAKIYVGSSLSYLKKNENPQQKENEYLLVMLKGCELGLPPMAAIDMIDVISGKPVISAKGLLALAKSSGEMEDIQIDSTDDYCTVVITRKGNSSHLESFTKQDAMNFKTFAYIDGERKKIPLWEKDNWQSQPATMLKWRAVSAGIRAVFPDKVAGLYTKEEMAHTIDADIIVRDDGEMELVPREPITPPTANKNEGAGRPPRSEVSNTADKETTQNTDSEANTPWPQTELGKKQITGKLVDLGLKKKEDMAAYLLALGVDGFSDVKHKSFDVFSKEMDALYVKLNPAKPKKKKEADTSGDEKTTYTLTVDMLDIENHKKGKRNNYVVVFGGFIPDVGSVRVYEFSRSKFVKMLQEHEPDITKWEVANSDGEEFDVTKLAAVETYHTEPLEITFELTGKKTKDSDKSIGKLLDAKPAAFAEADEDSDEEDGDDLFDVFFGDDEEDES